MSENNPSLNITIVTSGSRGDVQPYIALGLTLKSKGHNITVATEERMKPLVEEFGLRYARIGGDPTGLLFEPAAQKVLKDGSMFKLIKLTEERDKKRDMKDILESYFSACSGSNIIVSAALTMTQSYTVAEYLQCTWIPMILGPTLPTSEFPLWALESLTPFSCMNKWSYEIAFAALWSSESKYINPWRQSLGLKPIKEKKGIADLLDQLRPSILVCYSPLICPNRRIPVDYPSNANMLGFVFVKPLGVIQHDPKLISFLASDPQQKSKGTLAKSRPIIYLGFGSMPAPNGPAELLQLAVDTCTKAKCRAVVALGWSGINRECEAVLSQSYVRDTIFTVSSVHHEWLFPQMECIVHHCGVGTMAAALRSGKPQIPCPFMLDQPHNSRTIVRMGCAPSYVPFNSSFSAAKLATELDKVLHGPNGTRYRQRAAELGTQISRESSANLDAYANLVLAEHKKRRAIAINGIDTSNPLISPTRRVSNEVRDDSSLIRK